MKSLGARGMPGAGTTTTVCLGTRTSGPQTKMLRAEGPHTLYLNAGLRPAHPGKAAVAILSTALLLGAAASAGPATIDLKRPDPRRMTVTTISAGEALEWAGAKLAGGDVNGDGLDNLVIAAPGGTDDRPSRRGRIYVVFGSLQPPRNIDVAIRYVPEVVPGQPGARKATTDADVLIDGADDFDHLGTSLAVADLDADGFADIIAGAPKADGPLEEAGRLRRSIRRARGLLAAAADRSERSGGVRVHRIIGRAVGDAFGTSLAAADVEGDGRLDLISGAPLAKGPVTPMRALDTGEVVVLSGGEASSWPAVIDLAQGSGVPRFILSGTEPGVQTGYSVAAGDFDGDGIHDLAVSARAADAGGKRYEAGEVYLVFGGTGLRQGMVLRQHADAVILFPNIGDLGGGSLAFGDVDGDRHDDLIVAAEFADGQREMALDAGDVMILAGRARPEIDALRPPTIAKGPAATRSNEEKKKNEADPRAPGPVVIDLADATRTFAGVVTLHGVDPGDHTGVLGAFDLDEDGKDEVLLGASDAASRRNARGGGGEMRILPGGPLTTRAAALTGADGVVIYGPQGNTHFGAAAAALDLDGDGRPELVAGGPTSGRSLSGRVWVMRGVWGPLLRPPSGP